MSDFASMSGSQLLEAYNSLAGLTGRKQRSSKFQSKAEGAAACAQLQREVDKKKPVDPDPPREGPKSKLRHSKVIRLLSDRNPRRPGTDAHRHYEAMAGGITVGEYLAKFEDRGLAARWLWNTVRDGHAKLLG